MAYDIIKDTATITTVPEKALRKLAARGIYCINDAIVESLAGGEQITDLDIGIGNLAVGVVDDKVVYKFTPSQELDSAVKDAVLNRRNLLEGALEAALVERLTNTYKDIL